MFELEISGYMGRNRSRAFVDTTRMVKLLYEYSDRQEDSAIGLPF